MSSPAAEVTSAIRAIQAALAEIDRTLPADQVRRREAEAILSRLADSPVALLVADDRGRYVDVNVAATTLTGYTRSEVLQMSVWQLTPVQNQAQGKMLWAAFLKESEQAGTYRLRRKDGTFVTTAYFATAHVLPNLHLSALAMTPFDPD